MNFVIKKRIGSSEMLSWWMVRNRWQIKDSVIDMEEKRREINKTERLKIWNKGYFGQFWRKNKKDN